MDGHEALLEAGDVDDRPLEALGRVERRQVDGIGGAAAVVVSQRRVEPRQERCAGAFGFEIEELPPEPQQLGDVGAPFVGEPADDRGDRLVRRDRERLVVTGRSVGRGRLGGRLRCQLRLDVGQVHLEGPAATTQAREDVLDLGLVEEPTAAPTAERDARCAEGLLEHRELRVGADEHRLVGPARARPVGISGESGDAAGLGRLGVEGDDVGHRAVGTVRHQVEATRRCLGQHRVGETEDLRGRPVVLVELDRLRVGHERRELVEELRVGAVPRVDRLVGVADHAQVDLGAHPCLQEPELQRVDVLELVDEQVAESPTASCGILGVGLDVAGREAEQVVEVDHATTELGLLVAGVDVGHRLGSDGHPAVGDRRLRRVVAGRDHACLGPLDLADDVERQRGRAAPHEARHEPDLAVEQLRRVDAALFPPLPELGVGDGVERAGVDAAAQAEMVDALAQLGGSLAGERDGEHSPRIDLALRHPAGDAAGEDPRLAGPGAGDDAQRQRVGRDGGGLCRVEAREQALAGGATGRVELVAGTIGGRGGVVAEQGLHAEDPNRAH